MRAGASPPWAAQGRPEPVRPRRADKQEAAGPGSGTSLSGKKPGRLSGAATRANLGVRGGAGLRRPRGTFPFVRKRPAQGNRPDGSQNAAVWSRVRGRGGRQAGPGGGVSFRATKTP